MTWRHACYCVASPSLQLLYSTLFYSAHPFITLMGRVIHLSIGMHEHLHAISHSSRTAWITQALLLLPMHGNYQSIPGHVQCDIATHGTLRSPKKGNHVVQRCVGSCMKVAYTKPQHLNLRSPTSFGEDPTISTEQVYT